VQFLSKLSLFNLLFLGLALANGPTDYISLQQESNASRIALAGAGVGQGGTSKWLVSENNRPSLLSFEKVWGDPIFESSLNRLDLRFIGLGLGWGFDGLVQDYGNLEGYDKFNSSTSYYKSGYNELGFSLTKSIGDFSAKLRTSGMTFRIDDKIGKGVIIGGHFLYAKQTQPWSIGIELSQFGFAETPLGDKANLPWKIQLGSTYKLNTKLGIWQGFLDANLDRDHIYRAPFALQWFPIEWMSLSTGYEVLEKESYPAAGLSIEFKGVEMNYTWTKMVELGSRHYLGIIWDYQFFL
jgi:hypothetical protein